MRYPVVLDLETKYTFREHQDPKKLGITVVGLYDYCTGRAKAFFEGDLGRLYPLLEHASLIIGFNIDSFDLPVLQGYYPGDVGQFKTFDILADIKEKLGKRLSLNHVVSATLGKRKSGHGLEAVELYREGKLEKLKKYCLDDVFLTRELFDYGVSHGQIFYLNAVGKVPIKTDWQKYLEAKKASDVSLTLPFS